MDVMTSKSNLWMRYFIAVFMLSILLMSTAKAAYIVSGAGDDSTNGLYLEYGLVGDVPAFRKEGGAQTWYLKRCYGRWYLEPYEFCMGDYYQVNSAADTPPETGWSGWFTPAPTVLPSGPVVNFSSKTFFESLKNDGSFSESVILNHNLLNDDGFTGHADDDFLQQGKALLTNLPAGLTASLIFISSSELELSISGNAENSGQIDTVTDLTLHLLDSAFINVDASANINAQVNDLTLQFRDLHTVGSSGDFATIAAAVAAADPYDILQLEAEVFTEKNITINKALVIRGAGAEQTIIQAMEVPESETGKIFTINSGLPEIRVSDLTLRNGNASGGNSYGGAIDASSPLFLENCRLTNNRNTSSGIGGGGAINSNSKLTVTGCLFDENSAYRTSGGQVWGGAIRFSGLAEITNSTFYNNSLSAANSSTSTQGGAISPSSGSTLILIHSTLVNNHSSGWGGGIGQESSSSNTHQIINTIISGNSSGLDANSADISVPVSQKMLYSHSVVGNRVVVNDETLDNLLNEDPLLGPLADNGGPTQTLALLSGSPAVGAGQSGSSIPKKDQRGFWRVGSVDVGAYQVNGFALNFDANGADGGDVPLYRGEDVYPEQDTLTKIGFSFIGWNHEADGSGTAYVSGDSISQLVGEVTLYAQWVRNQYTINFDSAGGSSIQSITQDFASKVAVPVVPIKEGHNFLGWSPEVPVMMPAENLTLTAQWSINQYTITFNSNGGSPVKAITQNFGTTVNAPPVPIKDNHSFIGWTPSLPGSMPANNLTLTAQWNFIPPPSQDNPLITEGGERLDSGRISIGEELRFLSENDGQFIESSVVRGEETTRLIPGQHPNLLIDEATGNVVLWINEQGVYVFESSIAGRYELIFQNEDQTVVVVEFLVLPQLAFASSRQFGTDGDVVEIRLIVNGLLESSAIDIEYEIENHFLLSNLVTSEQTLTLPSGSFAVTQGKGTQSMITLLATPNSVSDQVVVSLNQEAMQDTVMVGTPDKHVIQLRLPQQMPFIAKLTMSEQVARLNDEDISISVNAPQAQSFDWSRSTPLLNSVTGNSTSISPSILGIGVHPIRIEVTHEDGRRLLIEERLRIVEDISVSYTQLIQQQEQNGSHRLPICSAGEFRAVGNNQCIGTLSSDVLLEVPSGYRLRMGQNAEQVSWSEDSFGIGINTDNLKDSQGNPANNRNDTRFEHLGYLIDFEISELQFPGQSVPVVVPLPEGTVIPENATWRKWHGESGWRDFESDGLANQLHSAPRVNGICPWSGSPRWQSGLITGYGCIRLIIEDGGPNDIDERADGVIRDPGTLALGLAEQDKTTQPIQVVSSGGAMSIMYLFTIFMLGVHRRSIGSLLGTKRSFILIITTMMIVLSFPSVASEPRNEGSWYLGGQLGGVFGGESKSVVQTRLDQFSSGNQVNSLDSERLGLRIFGGFKLNKHFALEVGYVDLGKVKTQIDIDPLLTVDTYKNSLPGSGSGVDFSIIGLLPVTDSIDFFTRTGIFVWKEDVDIHEVATFSRNGHSGMFSIGARYQWCSNWSLLGELAHYRSEHQGVHMLTLGLIYNF
ncbi:InlB B-repeat-containing protein [Vibrio metschnikovii]|uniref:InlB B-repeat-containing protein n=1 Tax=Vibrio metschnikovii TaxID=28172 RepID=UPI002FE56134